MKLNKEKLNALASMDDASLWREIYSAAQKFGYALPEKAPDAKSLEKIRSVIIDADKISALDVARLFGSLKEKKKKE